MAWIYSAQTCAQEGANFYEEIQSARFIEKQIDKITYLIEVKESDAARETVYQKQRRRIENDAKQASHQALHCVNHSESKSTSSS